MRRLVAFGRFGSIGMSFDNLRHRRYAPPVLGGPKYT